MSNIEAQPPQPQMANSPKSLPKQLLCSFVINLVSFLQGASVSTSSIILHSLQNSDSSNSSISNSNSTSRDNLVEINLFEDFTVSEEDGSWIGRILG